VSDRLLVSLAVGVAGLLLLALALWLRAGRPLAVRRWMNPLTEDWMAERVVLLGLPTAGALLVCAAVLGGFPGNDVLRLSAVLAMALLAVPALCFLIAPLPLPSFLYPAWARALRDGREGRREAFLSGRD